ncbi:hypothetical protein OIO90_005404 [Microbotryomycetes sp. JL221]|nr:hypothetical protein OIO90_005404 [Microbotryomycetes sp. JL221]
MKLITTTWLLVVLLAVLALAQDNGSGTNSVSTPPSSNSASSNQPSQSVSLNSTASVNNTGTTNSTMRSTTSTTPLTTVDATPTQFANPQITAIAPGAAGTVASGPNDNYIAAAGRLFPNQQVTVLGLAGLAIGVWTLA